MAAALFLVNIPRKEHEEALKKARSAKNVMEKEKSEKASKLIRELKTNKRFGNIKSSFESYRGERGLSKCKSTECVHENGDFGMFKSKSDNVLNESSMSDSGECQFGDKSSWDIKQVMRRKKKLRITQPASLTDISGAFHWDTPLEFILSEVITRLDIKNATWTSSKENKYWQGRDGRACQIFMHAPLWQILVLVTVVASFVLFSLDSCYECEELLQVLRNLGIGSRYNSSISVIPCTLYYKASNDDGECFANDIQGLQCESHSAWTRFSSTVSARVNLAQILHDVQTDAALTFDWLFLLVVAALVAAIGLVENSTVILVASMLISPLMGPITAATLGTAVKDRSLQQVGVLHELLGLFLALVIGFIFGLVICAVDGRYGVGEWPTYEMMTRCEVRSLWVGVLVALPSGAGVALSVLGENTASLVGVAISASLLPPAVNAGLLWAMALVHLIFADDQTRFTGVVTTYYYSSDQPTELAVLGTVSLCLTLVNIACIFVAGVAVYKVKEVCPLERRDILWWRANRKSNRSSKRFNHNNNINWENYRNFSNDSCKTDLEIKEPMHLIQSDTVTYRRETPAIRRMRAQNIEAYCLQKEQFTSMPNNFEANIHDDRHIYNSIENLPLKSDITDMRISNNIEKENFYNKEYMITDLDNVNSFSNAGFEEQENFVNKGFEQNMEKQCPVIEPSSNLTVDPKPRIILGSQSYNV